MVSIGWKVSSTFACRFNPRATSTLVSTFPSVSKPTQRLNSPKVHLLTLYDTAYSDLVANATGTIWEGKYLTVGAASQSALSFLRVYSDVTAKKIYPYLTAIISVKRGVVQGITWDEACMFCSPSECEEITYDFNGDLQTLGQPTTGCFVPYQDCKQTICDLTLYVVWTGTDSNNRAFQSSASRFSAFPSQDWKDRVLNNLPDIPIPGVNRQLTAVDVPPLGQDL